MICNRENKNVTKLRKISKPDAKLLASIESSSDELGFENFVQYSRSAPISSDLFERSIGPSSVGFGDWRQTAYLMEKQRDRREKVDLSFAVPVWIAAGLYCSIIHVLVFRGLTGTLV